MPTADPLSLTSSGWERLAESWSLPRYRGRQIFDALHRRGVRAYGEMRELPADLRERLVRELPLEQPRIVRREESSDGSVKYGLALADGALIEAVFMPGLAALSAANEFEDARAVSGANAAIPAAWVPPRPHNHKGSTPPGEKYTVCLSSQTGCAVDCAFCVTGRLGGGRNLTTGEIVGQLYAVTDDVERTGEGLRIVFMGMGEPFLNLDQVSGALDVLFETLSPRRVTVSTSGITPGFAPLAQREKRPNLAVSVNAADPETRARLMPIERTYPISGVVAAMRAWPLESHRRLTAEYVLIAEVNDSPADAARLASLLAGLRVKVNVIPLNEDPTYLPGWKRPSEDAIDRFVARLADSGVAVTVRRSRGPDASAACGQLKGRLRDIRKKD